MNTNFNVNATGGVKPPYAPLARPAAGGDDGAPTGHAIASDRLHRVGGPDGGLKGALANVQREVRDYKDRLSGLAQMAQGTNDAQQLQQLTLQINDMSRRFDAASKFQSLAGRVANSPFASEADKAQMAALATQFTATNDPAAVGRLLAGAEDVARNVGRSHPTDRNLTQLAIGMAGARGEVESQMHALTAEAMGTTDAEQLQKIQMKLADLKTRYDQLGEFKGAIDKLLKQGDAPGEKIQQLQILAADAFGSTDAAGLRETVAQAQRVARDANRETPTDPALNQALAGLADRQGTIDGQRQGLTNEAMGETSTMHLQQIQIQLADLGRTQDVLDALKREADRIANEGGDNQQRAAELLDQAAGTTDFVKLMNIQGAMQQL